MLCVWCVLCSSSILEIPLGLLLCKFVEFYTQFYSNALNNKRITISSWQKITQKRQLADSTPFFNGNFHEKSSSQVSISRKPRNAQISHRQAEKKPQALHNRLPKIILPVYLEKGKQNQKLERQKTRRKKKPIYSVLLVKSMLLTMRKKKWKIQLWSTSEIRISTSSCYLVPPAISTCREKLVLRFDLE